MGFNSIGEAGHARTGASHHRHHPRIGDRRQAAESDLRSKKHSELRQRGQNDDQLTLGRDEGQGLNVESRSLAVARFKSDLRIRQTDDGTLKLKYKSQLKFNYEFESEDGTTIQLSAKVKTRLSFEQAADGSFELKTRVKLQISALQESVQAGIAPAVDASEQGDSQSSAIATSLQEFQALVDQVTNQFLEDAASGDDLIVEIVDAFNELAGSVASELPEAIDQPKISAEDAPLASAVDDLATPVEVLEPPAAEVVASPGTESTIEEPNGDGGGNPEPADGDGEVTVSTDDADDATATSTFTRRSVLVDLRINFIQSISGLTSVLDSSAADGDASSINASVWERTKIDFRLATYSKAQPLSLSDSLPGLNVDANG